MNRYFTVRQDARPGEADILIYGDITSWEWEESDVSSYTLARLIQTITAPRINVRINSYGGEVAEALAIIAQLANSGKEIVTFCDGFACSAAADIFMAGQRRIMAPSSVLMIHNAASGCYGNASEMRKAAEDLDLINDQTLKLFADKVKISEAELRQLFDAETFLSPEQALEMGFATEIARADQAQGLTQSARVLVMQRLTTAQEPPAQEADNPQEKEVERYAAFFQNINI